MIPVAIGRPSDDHWMAIASMSLPNYSLDVYLCFFDASSHYDMASTVHEAIGSGRMAKDLSRFMTDLPYIRGEAALLLLFFYPRTFIQGALADVC